jgi:hypothetical protein
MSFMISEDGDVLNVRAIINSETEQDELALLIKSLQQRLRDRTDNKSDLATADEQPKSTGL